MEYKSELIDFEKEDMESKKRMLGSDKVDIKSIKKMVDEAVPSLENANELRYLLSMIEQAEKALEEVRRLSVDGLEINRISIEALQAIRK